MLAFVLRRIVLLIPVLIGLTMLVFAIARLLPGDPVALAAGPKATPAEIAAYAQGVRSRSADRRAVLALCHRPAARRLGRLDLHAAPGRRRISPPICRRRSNSSSRRCCSPSSIGIPAGLMAAVYRDRWPDYVSRVVSLGAISMPRFFLGLLLQLGFAMWLGLLPLGGRFPLTEDPPAARHRLPHHRRADRAATCGAFVIALQHLAAADRRDVPVAARDHHAHDARLDHRGAAAGLCAHRARARPVAAAHRLQVCAAQRRLGDADRDRPLFRLAARRHRAGRDRVRLAGHRALRHEGRS